MSQFDLLYQLSTRKFSLARKLRLLFEPFLIDFHRTFTSITSDSRSHRK